MQGKGRVSRALMFPGQEAPSPSCAPYLFGPRARARSPIFIRLYLRLESVPLHFLSRSSLSLSLRGERGGSSHPLVRFYPPARAELRDDAVTTTCKHSGICNSNAAKRALAVGEREESLYLYARGLSSYPRAPFVAALARALSLCLGKR